jgi:hypothetical protein
VRLYRSVSPDELADIQRAGRYRLNRGSEGKRFFPTFEQASRFSWLIQKIDRRPYTVTSIEVDLAALRNVESFAPATEGPAIFLGSPPAGRPTVHTYTGLVR